MNVATKLNNALLERVSAYLHEDHEELSNEFWIITIHRVEVIKDLSYADFFITCTLSQEKLTKAIAKIADDLSRKAFRDLGMRKMPKFRFLIHAGQANSNRILDLIDALNRKK